MGTHVIDKGIHVNVMGTHDNESGTHANDMGTHVTDLSSHRHGNQHKLCDGKTDQRSPDSMGLETHSRAASTQAKPRHNPSHARVNPERLVDQPNMRIRISVLKFRTENTS